MLEKVKKLGARVILFDFKQLFLLILHFLLLLLVELVRAESVTQIVVAVLEVFEILAMPGAVALAFHAMLAK